MRKESYDQRIQPQERRRKPREGGPSETDPTSDRTGHQCLHTSKEPTSPLRSCSLIAASHIGAPMECQVHGRKARVISIWLKARWCVSSKEGGEVNVTPISNNIDVEVRNRSEQSVDIIGGRLKQFASQ